MAEEEEEEGNNVKGPVGTGEENHVAAEGVRQMKQEHPQVVVERQSLLPLLVADTSMVVQRQQQHRHGHNIVVVVVVLQESQENMEEEEEEVVGVAHCLVLDLDIFNYNTVLINFIH